MRDGLFFLNCLSLVSTVFIEGFRLFDFLEPVVFGDGSSLLNFKLLEPVILEDDLGLADLSKVFADL